MGSRRGNGRPSGNGSAGSPSTMAPSPYRVLIYSHDSFGLGHLRRCRAIAQGLVAADPDMSVLILSGSPIIGRFDFGERVDFVRIPGIIKLENGEYTTLALGIDLEQTLAMREAIIRHTALAYEPDLFIVDKEPLGLRGEVRDTLALLRGRGCPAVLGLRDVARHRAKDGHPRLEASRPPWMGPAPRAWVRDLGCDLPLHRSGEAGPEQVPVRGVAAGQAHHPERSDRRGAPVGVIQRQTAPESGHRPDYRRLACRRHAGEER